MIRTVLLVSWLNLKRDRIAQGLAFVLPIGVFSVFAAVFGGTVTALPRVGVAVVDEDGTALSGRLVGALGREQGLDVVTTDASGTPLTRAGAQDLVVKQKTPVAIIVRAGFADRFGRFAPLGLGAAADGNAAAAVDLLVDTSDPAASQVVAGLLQRAAISGLPDVLLERGVALFERVGGDMTESQRAATAQWTALLRAAAQSGLTQSAATAAADTAANDLGISGGLVSVNVVDLLANTPKKSPVNAFYAAGTAVLFMLFSALGAAGILLEEQKNGTLERLLVSNLTMGQLLVGRWLYGTVLGMAQLTIMFVWGALVFAVDLFTPRHLAGFAVMTTVTAAAASSFGLVLASLCRSRAQLDGVGTIVILVMSALGGSMFPRFLMADWMKQVGLVTFNAWALDGYQKVFWYERGVLDLWPQVAVLLGLTAGSLLLARVFARRWETL